MKKQAVNSKNDPQILAVLHRAGGVWRGMIANTRQTTPAIVAQREFTSDRIHRVDEWFDEHFVGQVLCVLPAGNAVCRNCPLPDAAPEQLQQALQLQAEAHLLGVAPPHRLSMAVLPTAPNESTRTGLVIAWPEAAMFEAPATSRPIHFISEVAAMAALLNGQRPDEPLLWMDRTDGSVALAIAHPGGAVFRATREEAASSDDWQRRIARIIAETSLGVGHSGSFIDAAVKDAQLKAGSLTGREARLFIPSSVLAAASSRIERASSDPTWWAHHGILVGAILARTGPLAPLTHLLQTAPVERPPLVRRTLETLAKPQVAMIALIACVLVMMLSPLVFSGMRLAILTMRFGNIDDQLIAATQARQKVAMYQELEKQKAWPMTKLLSDIVTCTPIGIELETVRIEAGKDFAVAGVAISPDSKTTPGQLVANMQENLASYGRGMFTEISVTAGKTDNLGRYRFDLSAKVNQPYAQPKIAEELDFIKNPYAVRIYGERARVGGPATTGAVAETPAQGAVATNSTSRITQPVLTADETNEDDGESDTSDSDYLTSSSSTREGSAFGDNPIDRGGNAVDPRAVPPPLDTEQIKVMSNAELKDALSKIGRARGSRDLDQETKERLKKEWDMVMDQLRKNPTQ